MARRYNICMLLMSLLFMACDSSLPRSGGRPFDVAVVAGDEVTGRLIMRGMSECTEYFTDDEPMFRLSLSKENGREDVIRMARTLIIIDTADVKNTVALREYNVWARPQLVLYVHTPSAKRLSRDMKDIKEMFAHEINDFERNILLKNISRSRNIMLEDSIAKYTGMDMYVPASMKIAHSDSNFIWLTSYSGDENHSLCVYRTHRDNVRITNMKSVSALRDSMMYRHIKGVNKDVHWRITPGTERAETRHDTIIVRNRWELTGDAMGGSSACRIMEKGDSIVFAESFIYAPASAKRNKMRRAEALLYSCRMR